MTNKESKQFNQIRKDSEKKERNRIRQQFLLSFFENEPKYQEQNINGFWLIKQFNGNTEKWQVGIYTEDTFKRYKEWSNRQGNLLT